MLLEGATTSVSSLIPGEWILILILFNNSCDHFIRANVKPLTTGCNAVYRRVLNYKDAYALFAHWEAAGCTGLCDIN